jgi:hypothetical protein
MPKEKFVSIIYGMGMGGKRPVAAQFSGKDPDDVADAAKKMKLKFLDEVPVSLIKDFGGLPEGKLFESGKAFVPVTKKEKLDALVTYAKSQR